MFNKNFYPTPLNIIHKMCGDISNDGKYILEPSAGKGDILDYLKRNESSYCYNNKLFAIEIEPELRMILKGKKYPLLAFDFLTYVPDYNFDYIIMNPPFDISAKHLLHAIDIGNGAEIRCLLNKETLNNLYTKERQVLKNKLEELNYTSTDLGNCFNGAERSTNVDVVLITVKTKKQEFDFDFEPKDKTEKQYSFEDININQVAFNDVFQNLESRYNKIRELYVKQQAIISEMNYYADGLTDDSIHKILNDGIGFSNALRKSCWNNIFHKTKLSNLVTSNVMKKLNEYQQDQSMISFTKENIEELFYTLMENKNAISKQCILDAFDEMTKYHEENRIHFEGWKTNDSYKVNKKVIFPYAIDTFSLKYSSNPTVSIEYRFRDRIIDIEKALCFISGKKFEEINSIDKCYMRKDLKFGQWHDSEFFEWKGFKKGTIHIKFKNEYIYQEFNRIACEGKNWIPPKTKKSYK